MSCCVPPFFKLLIFKSFAFRPISSSLVPKEGHPCGVPPRLRRGSPSPIKCPPSGGAHQLPPASSPRLGRSSAGGMLPPDPLGFAPCVPFGTRAPLRVDQARGGWAQGGWATQALSTLRSNPLFNTKRENLKKLVEQGRRPRSWGLWVCGRRLGSRWAIPVVKLVGRRSLSISLSSRVVHGPSEASQPVPEGHRPHIHGPGVVRGPTAPLPHDFAQAKSSEYTQALSGPPEAPPCAAPVAPVGHQEERGQAWRHTRSCDARSWRRWAT